MLDIVMTATKRPEILRTTLESFKKYMLDTVECRLIINVDPVGVDYVTQMEVVAIAGGYFPNLLYKCSEVASFPKAFKWVFLRSESDYVLYLEDDWELLRIVDFVDIVMKLNENPKLALLRLAAFHASESTMKNWNKFFPYDAAKGYFVCPDELKLGVGFCGHPSVIKKEFIDKTVPYLASRANPEKQFHRGGPKEVTTEVMKWEFGVYSKPNNPPLIRDIGRRWMVENNFRKAGSKAFFTNWCRVDEEKANACI